MSNTLPWCCLLYMVTLTFESVDEILKCEHCLFFSILRDEILYPRMLILAVRGSDMTGLARVRLNHRS